MLKKIGALLVICLVLCGAPFRTPALSSSPDASEWVVLPDSDLPEEDHTVPERISAREDLINRMDRLGRRLYEKTGGKAQRAHYSEDIYICKNFISYLFRQYRSLYRIGACDSVPLVIPGNLPSEDCAPYAYGIAWKSVPAEKGNPFLTAAVFLYSDSLSEKENMEQARQVMQQIQRGDVLQMSASYEYGRGAHTAFFLSDYDPEEALEYLPDAISNAKAENNEVKQIELLGYLARCCYKTGNYFGNVECVDNVLKTLKDGQDLERAMIISSKLSSLLDIGNCGEVISLADNDVLPVLNQYLAKPRLNKVFPLGLLFDSWLKVYLVLATALALQGNERCFEVLKNLFSIIDKHKINDKLLVARAKIVLAYANTMRGDISASMRILHEVDSNYRDNYMDEISISRLNLVYLINKFLLHDYDNIRQDLFEAVTFANNSGDNFTKNILKTLLGKVFKEENKAQRSLEIYNEQVSYFAKEKMALGALLSWYLIADATIVTENSKSAIDIASQALEISINPNIDNYFFAISLRMVLATAYMNIADYTSAKISIEEALKLAKSCNMYDMLSRIYLLYGKYYYDIGKIATQNQSEYLRGSAVMFEKSMEYVVKNTQNPYVKNLIDTEKEKLNKFCTEKGIKL